MVNVVVAYHLDICHQILDLYSQGKQQMPHHTPHQLQQPPSLHPTPQVPQVPQPQPSQGSEPPQAPQKDSQQPAQPPPPPAQQPKKPSPQPSPPRQVKRAAVSGQSGLGHGGCPGSSTQPACSHFKGSHRTPNAEGDSLDLARRKPANRRGRRGGSRSQDGSVLLL